LIGDGIGAEVTESVKTIFKSDNVPVEWEQVDVTGVVTGNSHPEELFRESVNSLKRNKVGLKGETYTGPLAPPEFLFLPHCYCVAPYTPWDLS